jgi:hypothetical protein
MNKKTTAHLVLLLSLLGAWAYLWVTPLGDFKPGGLEKHLLLMLFGGILAVYILVVSRRMWHENHQPMLAVNMRLSGLFIAIHLYYFAVISFNMVAR